MSSEFEKTPKSSKKELRTKAIKIRLTDKEFDELNKRKTQKELASWIRQTCLDTAPTIPQQFAKIDPKLLYQINKIGNNLNQLAKQVNTQPATLQTAQALATLAQIQADINEIKTLLSESV